MLKVKTCAAFSYSNIMSLYFFLVLYVIFGSARAQSMPPNTIGLGSSLHPTTQPTAWYSASGHFAFGFYPQGSGYKVGIWLVGGSNNNDTIVWTAFRDDPEISADSTLAFIDGIVVLKTSNGDKTIGSLSESAYYANLLDNGNFVLYNQDHESIYESFSSPVDTILGGQILASGGKLISSFSSTNHSSGRFRLVMQGDGNLVAYPRNLNEAVDAYWASQVYCSGCRNHLLLNSTGILLLINDTDSSVIRRLYSPLMQKNTGIYRATLDHDGNFRLYSHEFDSNGNSKIRLEWEAIDDLCLVKGFCGLNSFCVTSHNVHSCMCLPGSYLKENDPSFGDCQRNFTRGKCIHGKEDSSVYKITTTTNLTWEDPPYFATSFLGKEDCGKSCFEDCDCDAALFDEIGQCMKHKLPLRYVKGAPEGSHTGFFKVSNIVVQNPTTDSVKPPWVVILVLSISFVLYSGTALALSGFYVFKFRIIKYRKLLQTGTTGLTKDFILRTCSYRELKQATDGFKEELGKGAFGAVYKGSFDKGKNLVAVKRLEKVVDEGEREFRAEMKSIGRTRHRNLVRLLGYCAEGSKRALVYEYMSNGCLANLLFRGATRPDWNLRVNIALDVARGILYLHEECEAPIIHCDIKPQNILLDELLTAKISDFGLAKLLMPDQTRTFTGVRGTRGYLAPEWQTNTPISVKVDVYSYGIVLLEIICCRRNIEVYVTKIEEIQLSKWAYSCLVESEIDKLVGSEDVDKNTLERMISVAIWCIQDEPALRPPMKQVLQMLQGIIDIPFPPCPSSSS
ncbi:PREDICTED: G-type lectin S-receptor-like serine/threonine-protein kinase LECRK2 [Nicotiana attenuata]|nr:PREDICTED: G-type lectin S-receptor-like serine/threonine-protein kinase LECRK2 [Nicotiana attenuata]